MVGGGVVHPSHGTISNLIVTMCECFRVELYFNALSILYGNSLLSIVTLKLTTDGSTSHNIEALVDLLRSDSHYMEQGINFLFNIPQCLLIYFSNNITFFICFNCKT